MRTSWKLGRVAGIDLYLHPTFLLLLAFVFATNPHGLAAVLLVSAVFGCVALHELGHALAARAYGIGTEDITLYPIGGVARLHRMPRSPGAELLIALAGPAVNLGIAAVLAAGLWLAGALAPWADPGPVRSFAAQLLGYNMILALFNLVPAFPMDGGRVLRALLSGPLGRARATTIAATVGRGLAVAFGLSCLAHGLILPAILAAFVFFAAGAERAHVLAEEYRRRLAGSGGLPFAPPGYGWVRSGPGAWQLVPLVVTVHDRRARPWRG